MTIATFDLTEHTQMSIRGTTGTHPDSEFVFGVFIGTDEIHAEQAGFTPNVDAYDDMDWSKAVELAKWILSDAEFKNHFDIVEHNITDNCVAASVWNPATEDLELFIRISIPKGRLSGGMKDVCEWERAMELAKWILEWDERFRLAKELDTTVGIVSDMRETYSKIDEWGGKWMKEEKE